MPVKEERGYKRDLFSRALSGDTLFNFTVIDSQKLVGSGSEKIMQWTKHSSPLIQSPGVSSERTRCGSTYVNRTAANEWMADWLSDGRKVQGEIRPNQCHYILTALAMRGS